MKNIQYLSHLIFKGLESNFKFVKSIFQGLDALESIFNGLKAIFNGLKSIFKSYDSSQCVLVIKIWEEIFSSQGAVRRRLGLHVSDRDRD